MFFLFEACEGAREEGREEGRSAVDARRIYRVACACQNSRQKILEGFGVLTTRSVNPRPRSEPDTPQSSLPAQPRPSLDPTPSHATGTPLSLLKSRPALAVRRDAGRCYPWR